MPLILFLVAFTLTGQAFAAVKMYRVTDVHDGDTITVRVKGIAGLFSGEEKVRLIGIDAPELRQKPWGKKAKNHLNELISESNGVVGLQLDVESRDKYGRLLAYVWDSKGKLLINEKMIGDGYAMLYTFPPNVKHVERLRSAQTLARQDKEGIWGRGGLRKSPSQWRREHRR